jgi:hypothetical protein
MFGNARFARNLLEAAIGRHAWRLRDVAEPTVEQLRMLIADDFDEAAAETEPATAAQELPIEADAATPKEYRSEPG